MFNNNLALVKLRFSFAALAAVLVLGNVPSAKAEIESPKLARGIYLGDSGTCWINVFRIERDFILAQTSYTGKRVFRLNPRKGTSEYDFKEGTVYSNACNAGDDCGLFSSEKTVRFKFDAVGQPSFLQVLSNTTALGFEVSRNQKFCKLNPVSLEGGL